MRFVGVVFSSNCPSWSYGTLSDAFYFIYKISLSYSSFKTCDFLVSETPVNCEMPVSRTPISHGFVRQEQMPGVRDTGEMRIAGVRETEIFLLFPIFHKLKAIATAFKATRYIKKLKSSIH